MTILVFDDNGPVCKALVNVIRNITRKHDDRITFQTEGVSQPEALESWLSLHKPDIAVLDIAVAQDDEYGIKCAKLIRQKHRDCHIIFVTGHEDKITKVFNGLIRPTQFIVKDELPGELEAVIGEIVDDVSSNNCSVKVSYGRNEYILNTAEIIVIQKSGRKTEICLSNRQIEVADTVSSIAKALPSSFKFVDKGVVVNLKQVTQANYPEKTLYMSDGQEVYMSRNSIHDVKLALAELMGGGENVGVAVG